MARASANAPSSTGRVGLRKNQQNAMTARASIRIFFDFLQKFQIPLS
jgi:hypothetical protein